MTEPVFKRPELEDREIISSYFEKAPSRSCERTFVNVYLWSRHYRVQYAVIEDALVFRSRDNGIAFSYPAGEKENIRKAVDYLTGVMCAISDKTLSSNVGFRGICRKVLIFLLVGIANILDVHVIGTGSVLRTAVIFFYISNEGVSLLENAAHLGLPVPGKIKAVLEQLHDRAEKTETEEK